MLMFLASAFALDCNDPAFPGPACPVVNQLADMIENQTGTPIIADNAPVVRLRTATLYHRFEALRLAVLASGCPAPNDFVDAGVFNAAGVGEGTWEAIGASPFVENPVDIVIDRDTRTFSGTYNDGAGVYGNFYASFNGYGKLLSQYDTPGLYVAGFWVRTNGNNGVWVAYESGGGGCPTSAEVDLGAWYATP